MIEPDILVELVRDHAMSQVILEKEIEEIMENILCKSIYLMAGNKILLQNAVNYFPKSMPCQSDIIKKNLYVRLTECQAETVVEVYINTAYDNTLRDLEKQCVELADLHKYVNGKYFLFNFRHVVKNILHIKGLRDDEPTVFHLARIIKNKQLSNDLLEIAEYLSLLVSRASR